MPDPTAKFKRDAKKFAAGFEKIHQEISKVIVGQDRLIDDVLTGLFSGGHILLEGVPGIGKTVLVNTLADSIASQFSRIQFTPDLIPSDIIGTRVVHEDASGRKHFKFQPGPVFTQVLLADEINRATPKTQSALLEAMQEKSVTVYGESHHLKPPFFVMATQNPLEMEGTYPLPEAQLDRFQFKLLVAFPSLRELVEVSRRTTAGKPAKASPVIKSTEVVKLQNIVREIPIAEHVEEFAAKVVIATHPDSEFATPMAKQYVKYGASPRGLQAIVLGSKVRALLDGRFNVAIDDIKAVATPSLRHRVLLNFEGEAEETPTDQIIAEVLDSITVDPT
ncbi:MoxR family ATPase [Verrucomicrobia bacterium]|nr:MoxR family ATPase [Verrucomicrobiota bacterium]MDA7867320.1 MoxR family ATPase [Verrucomicrobiota bacterium]